MNYAHLTTTITFSIALPCTVFAAMQSVPLDEQKKDDQKQLTVRQTAMPILEELLPKVLAALVHDYLPRDYHTYTCYKTIEVDSYIQNYQLLPDNKHMLVYHLDRATLWNIQTGTQIRTIDYNLIGQPYWCIHLKNTSLLMITENRDLRLHNFVTGESRILNSKYYFYNALFNGNGTSIFAHYKPREQLNGNYIGIFNTDTRELIASKQTASTSFKAPLAISVDDRLLAYTSFNTGHLATADMKKNSVQLQGHTANISNICFSHDAKFTLTTSRDQTARIWEASSGKQLRLFQHSDHGLSAQFDPSSTTILTGCDDNKMRLFDIEKENECFPFQHKYRQKNPTFSPDGSLIVAYDYHKIYLWRAPEVCTTKNKKSQPKEEE